MGKVLKEVRKVAGLVSGEEPSRWREQPVQKAWGRTMPGMFTEEQARTE